MKATKICRECGVDKNRNEFRTFSQKRTYTKSDGSVVSKVYDCYENKCKECTNAVNRRYYANNREHYAAKCRERYIATSKSRISKIMQTNIRGVLSGKKCGAKWQSLVGYTTEQLIKRLESMFENGMSWDNYGEWHVDHIVPKSWFHYEGADDWQFKVCWSLCNLQPMWAFDNLSKHNRYQTGGA